MREYSTLRTWQKEEMSKEDIEKYELQEKVSREGVKAPVSNYYGYPLVYEYDGTYWLGIEDWDGTPSIEISKEFYEAFVKEFDLTSN